MYNKFQEELISKILTKEIYNVSSFNEVFCKNDYRQTKWRDSNYIQITSIIPFNKRKTKSKFKKFIALIDSLEEAGKIEFHYSDEESLIISKEKIGSVMDTVETPPKRKKYISYICDEEIIEIYEHYTDMTIFVPKPF